MRYISLNKAKPGMLVGFDVFNSYNHLMVSAGTALTEPYIHHLEEMGITALYINDEYSKGIDLEPPISPILRAKGMDAVRKKDIDSCRLIAKQIVRDMLLSGFHSMNMQDLRGFDDYTFAHSVNVAVLSCTMGLGLHLKEDQLIDLVFASLLHDLGKLDIPPEILNKPGRLTPEEFMLIKTHPVASYNMIADRMDISSMVKNAVLCHHENHDGSGYPNGIKGDNISLLARILHITDVYDALTSARPYKPPYSPYAALEIISEDRSKAFAPEMVDAFVQCVPIYPKGTEVILSDGTAGIVIENSMEHNLRPIIRTEDMRQIDLTSKEFADYPIVSPSSHDFFDIDEKEEKRRAMIASRKKQNIMVLDYVGDTYRTVSEKLSYLYDFRRIENENSAIGYINKYGKPDLLIIDLDHYNIESISDIGFNNAGISEDINILVVGSSRRPDTIVKLRSIGITSYVLKPLHMIYLQSEIRKKLGDFL